MEILRDFFLSANIEMGDVGVSRYGMQEVDEFGVPVAKNNSLAKFLTGEILKGKVINSVTAHAPTPKNLQKALMSEIPTPHKVAASLGLNIKGSKLNMGSGDEFFMDSKL